MAELERILGSQSGHRNTRCLLAPPPPPPPGPGSILLAEVELGAIRGYCCVAPKGTAVTWSLPAGAMEAELMKNGSFAFLG